MQILKKELAELRNEVRIIKAKGKFLFFLFHELSAEN